MNDFGATKKSAGLPEYIRPVEDHLTIFIRIIGICTAIGQYILIYFPSRKLIILLLLNNNYYKILLLLLNRNCQKKSLNKF